MIVVVLLGAWALVLIAFVAGLTLHTHRQARRLKSADEANVCLLDAVRTLTGQAPFADVEVAVDDRGNIFIDDRAA